MKEEFNSEGQTLQKPIRAWYANALLSNMGFGVVLALTMVLYKFLSSPVVLIAGIGLASCVHLYLFIKYARQDNARFTVINVVLLFIGILYYLPSSFRSSILVIFTMIFAIAMGILEAYFVSEHEVSQWLSYPVICGCVAVFALLSFVLPPSFLSSFGIAVFLGSAELLALGLFVYVYKTWRTFQNTGVLFLFGFFNLFTRLMGTLQHYFYR